MINAKKNINSFISSIVFILIIPSIPIVIDYISDNLNSKSLFLFASIYPITVCISSKNSGVFSIAVLLSLFFALIYGFGEKLEIKESMTNAAYFSIWGTFIVHFFERINFHIVNGDTFFKFK